MSIRRSLHGCRATGRQPVGTIEVIATYIADSTQDHA
jgi:hypothetical protein